MLYGTRLHSTPALLPSVSGLTRTFTTPLEALHGSPSRVVRDSDLRYRTKPARVTATPMPHTGLARAGRGLALDGFAGRVPNGVEEADCRLPLRNTRRLRPRSLPARPELGDSSQALGNQIQNSDRYLTDRGWPPGAGILLRGFW